jgi:hypothetical protein
MLSAADELFCVGKLNPLLPPSNEFQHVCFSNAVDARPLMSELTVAPELARQRRGQGTIPVRVFSRHHHPQSASSVVVPHEFDVFAVDIRCRDMEAIADRIYGAGTGEDAINLDLLRVTDEWASYGREK